MDKNYESFFDDIKKFKIEQNKQKQEGKNDFNILTTVRNYHDEVYLHSSMIGALLDPKGLHYRDTLFLEKFFDVLKLDDFELDLSNVTVGVEYHDIDLYITDGTKHIIIENKIWADDQACQIIKYINIIKEENDLYTDDSEPKQPPKIEDIYVLYLTPNDTKKVSSEHTVDDKYISFKKDKDGEDKLGDCSKRANTKSLVPNGLKNYQVKYKKINYKDDILNWLNKCTQEVKNITNLNEAVNQYIDVVKMVNNNYKGKVMSIMEYIKNIKDTNEQQNYIQILNEIGSDYKKSKSDIKKEFFTNSLISYLKENIKDGWKIKFFGNETDINKKYKVNIQFYKEEDWNIVYWLRFEKNNINDMYWAIANKNNADITTIQNKLYKNSLIDNHKTTSTSLLWKKSSYDIEENIVLLINNNQETLAQNILEEFNKIMIQLENNYKYSIEDMNNDLYHKDK
ncbi:MAG: hypothetical protein DRG78_00895 [Epsilonproteobacteria bacterium]|nr:MAG: hypothetical protein DRG78_00895 [Campylobacterota bacterium]